MSGWTKVKGSGWGSSGNGWDVQKKSGWLDVLKKPAKEKEGKTIYKRGGRR